jgi:predicted dinucleotide-binding enzyme
MLSFARSSESLDAAAEAVGPGTKVGTASDAVAFAEVVVFSVPWEAIPAALAAAGPLQGRVVIDTTNQFGPGGLVVLPAGDTASMVNAARMPGARYVKSFNTLTVGFQSAAAGRTGPDRVALFYVTDNVEAAEVAEQVISDAGFAPIRMGGLPDAGPMEGPRRPGAVYGEEYNAADGQAFVDALRSGGPLPGPSTPG